MTNDEYLSKGSMPEATSRLAEKLRRLPGIGARTATLAAIQMSRERGDQWKELAEAIREANSAAGKCQECHGLADQETCEICRDPTRRSELVCVVERPEDVETIEAVGYYRGRYHVLHGVLDPLRGAGPAELTIAQLLQRAQALRNNPTAEIIMATSNTMEGVATADYIAWALEQDGTDVAVTTLRKGIADRAAVEFADPLTIGHAMRNRSDSEGEFPPEPA